MSARQKELFDLPAKPRSSRPKRVVSSGKRSRAILSSVVKPLEIPMATELARFKEFGKETLKVSTRIRLPEDDSITVPTFINEFWTSAQRAASRLHEISYRACFKPQLPRFFIERLTRPGDRVYDPFMGRGTTLVEAALLGRIPVGCDVNPLSVRLVRPRLSPPTLAEISARLESIPLKASEELWEDLLVFYHRDTLRQITALKHYLLKREAEGTLDPLDDFIRMVALNRLTGHSAGFFSVYTLPPNQATSIKAQIRINEKRKQTPPYRDVRKIILKKAKQLLSECDEEVRATLETVASKSQLLTQSCTQTPEIQSRSIQLVVTSPPFLDVVQYEMDNWLRCWFLGLDSKSVPITQARKLTDWQEVMSDAFKEFHRILRPGGTVAFEVGEVRQGTIKLEEAAIPCGVAAGFRPELILINAQVFTKTANCWGIDNNQAGTNTNRVILFRKE